MNTDLTLPVKNGVIRHLASDIEIVADVPEARIFGINTPAKVAWPFIRFGIPITAGFEATCWDGSAADISIHIFAEGDATMAGEDKALSIAGKVVRRMESLVIDDLGIVDNQWTQTTLLKDEPEADRWHAITAFSITAVKKDI